MRNLLEGVKSRVSEHLRGRARARVGFVGGGQHARTNLYPSLQYAPVDLVAVCTRRKETAEAVAKAFGASTAYDDFQAMFEKERLDAVFVCVSAREHFRIAAAALERGLHVFLEKPATSTADEADRLIDLEKKAGKHVMVGFQKRHAPAYRKAREIAEAPSFGSLSSLDAKFCVGLLPGGESAFLLEVGIHHLDLARFYLGDIEELHAERHASPKGTTTLALAMRSKRGAVASVLLSTAQSWRGHNERVELTGEGESLVIDNVVSLQHARGGGAAGGPYQGPGDARWEPNFTVPTIPNQTLHLNGFAPEIEHFADSVITGRKPHADLHDFRESLRLIERITAGSPAASSLVP